jgi:hypothetical protein
MCANFVVLNWRRTSGTDGRKGDGCRQENVASTRAGLRGLASAPPQGTAHANVINAILHQTLFMQFAPSQRSELISFTLPDADRPSITYRSEKDAGSYR